jgi:hypothetical protein
MPISTRDKMIMISPVGRFSGAEDCTELTTLRSGTDGPDVAGCVVTVTPSA